MVALEPHCDLGRFLGVAAACVAFAFPAIAAQVKAFHASFFHAVDTSLLGGSGGHIEVGREGLFHLGAVLQRHDDTVTRQRSREFVADFDQQCSVLVGRPPGFLVHLSPLGRCEFGLLEARTGRERIPGPGGSRQETGQTQQCAAGQWPGTCHQGISPGMHQLLCHVECCFTRSKPAHGLKPL